MDNRRQTTVKFVTFKSFSSSDMSNNDIPTIAPGELDTFTNLKKL